MIVQCEGCGTRFRLADDKLTPKGVRVRCSRCKKMFLVRGPAAGSEHAEEPAAGAQDSSLPEPPAASSPIGAETVSKKEGPATDSPPGKNVEEAGGGDSREPAEIGYDLDELLGKDFNLDLPPPGSSLDGASEQPAGDASSLMQDLDSAPAEEGREDTSKAGSGAFEEPLPDSASEQPAGDASSLMQDLDSAPAEEGREDVSESGGSSTEDTPSEPEKKEEDLSETLFEDLNLDSGAALEKEPSSLENMFEEGDLFRDDAPIPSEEDVDSALSALDISESSPEASEDIDLDADVEADVDVASWDDWEKSDSPQPDAAAGSDDPVLHDAQAGPGTAASEDRPNDEFGGLAKQDDGAGAAWGEPAAAGAASKGDLGWSLGPERPSMPPSGGDQAGMPGLGASDDRGSEQAHSSPFDASAAPALEMDGPPGLDLESLPPLDLAGSQRAGDFDESSSNLDLSQPGPDTSDDPFGALKDQETSSPDDAGELFDKALEEAPAEPEPLSGGNGEASSKASATPLGRISVGPPKKQQPAVKKPPEEIVGAPPSVGVGGALAIVANIVFAAALLVVALGAFVVFRTGGPIDASVFAPERVTDALTSAAAGGPRARVLTTGLYPTSDGGQLLYMRGELRNASDEDVAAWSQRLVGRAVDADGAEVRSSEAIVGGLPTPEELWNIRGAEDIERIRRRIERVNEREEEADGGLEFFVIFGEAPEDPYSLRFEVSLEDEKPAAN